jgi:predicted DNA-binding transcriptional regulator YafY
MRASRLLLILLMLQNRGRMTCTELAAELEVSRRTILRDVDALTEAGLPMVILRGRTGGIELGFNYRTRLTGLASDEAEALGVILGQRSSHLDDLGLASASARARTKLLESLPPGVRDTALTAQRHFSLSYAEADASDPRIAALATAVRHQRIVRIRAHGPDELTIRPVALTFAGGSWRVRDGASGKDYSLAECGRINLSRHTFDQPSDQAPGQGTT